MAKRPRTRKKHEKTILPEMEKIPCAFCRGKGKDPFQVLSPLSNCPVCQGHKSVYVIAPYETCPACEGSGVYIGSRLFCWNCHGKGVVHVRPEEEPEAEKETKD